MTDHPEIQAAVKVANIESSIAQLSERVATGLTHLTQLMGIAQDGQGRQSVKIDELVRNQHQLSGHPTEMAACREAITQLSRDFTGWRQDHEADNDGVAAEVTVLKAEVNGSLRTLRWSATIGAVLLSLLGTLGLYAFNLRLTSTDERMERQEAKQRDDAGANRVRIDRLDGRGNITETPP